MKKVKWGILSTASIAKTALIPAIKRANNAEVVAIASRGEQVYCVAEECDIPVAYASLQGTEPMYPGSESVKNMKVLQACLQSIEAGKVVQIK